MALAHKTQPQTSRADPDLYELDYYAWLTRTAAAVRAGRVTEADLRNIAEELEDMGRSEKRAIASHLGVLLLHLLKWQFQPQHRGSSWRGSIYNARRAIDKLLRESPSLRGQVPKTIVDEYPDARYNAINETGLPEGAFPLDCPYGIEEMLDGGFWPGES